jgi:MOSC domain-containing protein YiiM
MQGIIEQINISRGGVPKVPIKHAVVTIDGIDGDKHAHPQYHGGPRQALLIITAEGLEELGLAGFAVYAGALGENLTIRGLDRHAMRPGQRYRAGSVLMELTKVRQPCSALNPFGEGIQTAIFDSRVKEGDLTSPLWGLSGFYASVIEPNELRQGDIITLVD